MQSTDTHRQYLAAFSDSYHHARSRFWQACQSLGITPTSYPHPGTGPGGEELAVDVARLGPAEASRLIILSSGLHGSEALFGSAVLLHTLHSLDPHALHTRQLAVLLLHTLNPFGAAWGRRADAENIDLNRNFLLPAETIPPPDAIARRVDQLLNPPRPPSRFPELLALRFLPLKLRYGSRAVTQAIVGGQYHNPRGLFYGGDHPSWTQQLLQTHWHRWLGPAEHILHFDFHTGLGPHAQGQMLIDQDTPATAEARLSRTFAQRPLRPINPGSYTVHGGFDRWCRFHSQPRDYLSFTAEFGTYDGATVIAALQEENRAYFYGSETDRQHARAQLQRIFVPPQPNWRVAVMQQADAMVRAALSAKWIDP
jgi:hypothetical protein